MTPLRRRWTWATLAVVLAVAAVVGWVRVTGDPYGELVTDPASVDGTWEAVEVWGDYDPSDGIYVGVHGDRWQIGIGDGCNQLTATSTSHPTEAWTSASRRRRGGRR